MRVFIAMAELARTTNMVQPRYFYLSPLVRHERQSIALRWRSVGKRGTSLTFTDPRMQLVVKTLPQVMQQQYVDWEIQREALNHKFGALRHQTALAQTEFRRLIQSCFAIKKKGR